MTPMGPAWLQPQSEEDGFCLEEFLPAAKAFKESYTL